jgi:hypothetical protein
MELDKLDPRDIFLRKELVQEFEKHGIIVGAQIQDSQPSLVLGSADQRPCCLRRFFRV